METRDWLNEFTALKQVNPNNPFTVPAGYFDDLRERTLSLKNLDDITAWQAGFTVPENYFEELNSNINSRITVAAALNLDNTGFTLPDNYFNELSSNIQSRISIEEAAGSESVGFEVPEGYFNNLQQNITARIAIEEAVTADEPFAVPAGYFDKLNAAILSKTTGAEEQPAEQVPAATQQQHGVVRRFFTSGVYRYAAAACVTIAIGATFFFNRAPQAASNTNQHADSFLHSRLSNIPLTEIRGYAEQNLDAGETQSYISENVSDEELLDYINTEL
ncbi:hypothetical protein LJ707_08095 [Mucilaginibacter sp. UR6-1]|uniref:hypothetical protein n=1 Tax=Mucilaginibacter sp. UR6-1 TaxID=1435643 RepID=UPI001E406789|nr:hypothetical protein [Mucilaginibacter sp. UR6-1]MCC8408888.1 hypothetical protein [Mucilaginibacter sp. UR6-1]